MGSLHYLPGNGPDWTSRELEIFGSLHTAMLREGHDLRCVRGTTQDGIPYWILRENGREGMVRVMRSQRRYAVLSHELGLALQSIDLVAALMPIRERFNARKGWSQVDSAL
jgi:hypothetical protein